MIWRNDVSRAINLDQPSAASQVRKSWLKQSYLILTEMG
jgi:hypothetical protein